MMKVLMLALDRKIFEPGAARERLAALGSVFDELHIIVYARRSLGLAPQKIAERVWLYPTNSRLRLFYLRDAIRIGRLLAENRGIDVVSAQDPADTGLAAYCIARRARLPLHLQDHADIFNRDFLAERVANRLRALIARWLLPRAAGIRVVSAASAAHLIAALPRLARAKLFLLPVFVDIAGLRERVPTFSLHERYPQFDFIVLMAARLVPQKNIPLALRSLARAAKEAPGIGLVVVGEGPLKKNLEALARKLGIANRVAFVPWQEDLVPYYKGAGLFLMTSRYESYGRTLLEAAACGLPFVSSAVGAAAALAESGAGVVCADASERCFVERILAAARKPHKDEMVGYAAAEALGGASLAGHLARYREMMERCVHGAKNVVDL